MLTKLETFVAVISTWSMSRIGRWLLIVGRIPNELLFRMEVRSRLVYTKHWKLVVPSKPDVPNFTSRWFNEIRFDQSVIKLSRQIFNQFLRDGFVMSQNRMNGSLEPQNIHYALLQYSAESKAPILQKERPPSLQRTVTWSSSTSYTQYLISNINLLLSDTLAYPTPECSYVISTSLGRRQLLE